MGSKRCGVVGVSPGLWIGLRSFFSRAPLGDSTLEGTAGNTAVKTPTFRWSQRRFSRLWNRETVLALSGSLLAGGFYWLLQPPPAPTIPFKPEVGFRSRLPTGKLAYVLENEAAIPLRAGDVIDLYSSAPTLDGIFPLEGIEVIDAQFRLRPIVALTPEQVRGVELARQSGGLQVVLRNKGDGLTLRRKARAPSRPAAIQVWEGG